MTEQEVLSLTDEDIQKMQKLAMAKAGIAIMDEPKVPELFDITPPDLVVSTVYMIGDMVGFTDPVEAVAFVKFLKDAKSLVRVDYDYNKAGSAYKYARDARFKEKEYHTDPLEVKTQTAYSLPLYNELCDYMTQNRAMRDQEKKDRELYENSLRDASGIISEIRDRWVEVCGKYERLNGLCDRFTRDYLPLADNDRTVAMNFMAKAYSLSDEERGYILSNTEQI